MLTDLIYRLRALFRRGTVEAEMNDELRFHFEQQVNKYEKSGLSHEEAVRRARLAFGGIEHAKEECRDARGVSFIESVLQDIRYGVRMLRKARGFTAIALLTLALGIGATTAIFSVVDAVLLRPLPYRDAARLVVIYEDYSSLGYPRDVTSGATYVGARKLKAVFEDVAGASTHSDDLITPDGGSVGLIGGEVTGNLFSTLGVKPLRGRAFLPGENTPGKNHVVLLSYRLWQSRFDGNPALIGKVIRINAEPYTVVGVMPPGFSYPESDVQLWTPIALTAQQLASHAAHYFNLVGRLLPGVSLRQANAALQVLSSRIIRTYPDSTRGLRRFFAEPLQNRYTRDARRGLILLMAAVGCILLIACANLANLLLSRGAGRQRELAMRLTVGASRGRIIRQLLTESILLAFAGGVLGTLLADASFAYLKHLIPPDLSRSVSLGLDPQVLSFAIVVLIISSVLFGMVPALVGSNVNLNSALKEGGRGSTGSRSARLSNIFVVCEMALSLVLLLGAGIFVETLWNLRHVDPGFRDGSVLTAEFFLSEPKYRNFVARSRFVERVLDSVRALPGVQSAGFTSVLPLMWKGVGGINLTPEGAAVRSSVLDNASQSVITPGYFETLKIPLIRGRLFNNRDRQDAPLVAIINETMARKFWPNEDPIGKRFKEGTAQSDDPWIQIVGIVGDVKQMGLDAPPRQEMYFPYWQAEHDWMQPRGLVVRTASTNPISVLAEIRRAVARLDPAEPLTHVRTMTDIVDQETAQNETQTILLSSLAALALLMACIGIYGVMAYMVAQRKHEMGVRLALGATRMDVLALVLWKGMRLAFGGTVVGVVTGLSLAQFVRGMLFEVSPTDPLIIVGVALLLMAVALIACFVPAHRAAAVDPMQALRIE
ncbi:MAG: ADOP family duplicated permease [Bryobacteraceae bacterium]